MNDEQSRDVRSAIRQNLQTDALLGASEVPVSKSKAAYGQPGDEAVAARPRRPVGPKEAEKAKLLEKLSAEHTENCTECHLAETRNKVVFGQGSADTELVFVGEAPGAEEDRQGVAFVGRAGQLLTRMVQAMGLSRDDVFICNVLKCRPPGNRTPSTDEIAACSPYLIEQLQIIEPKIIVALGAPASQTLLDTKQSIGQLRGRFHEFYLSGTPLVGEPVKLMPTYHPAYLLRNPADKSKVWEDLKMVMTELDLPIPEKYR
jgi:DNA polymerase